MALVFRSRGGAAEREREEVRAERERGNQSRLRVREEVRAD